MLGKVNLTVTDLSDNHIKTIIYDTYEAGQYNLRWDGTDDSGAKVAPGFYKYNVVFEEEGISQYCYTLFIDEE